ncbi:hypothetical protein, partial [Campylobacter sp. CNRCH_2015_0814]
KTITSKETFALEPIFIKKYQIDIMCSKYSVFDVPNQTVTCKIKGGKAGSSIKYIYKEKGDFNVIQADKQFNSSQEATMIIKSENPFKKRFFVLIQALGGQNEFIVNYEHCDVDPKIVEYPKFENKEKTIDVESDFSIKISGLVPHSKIYNIDGFGVLYPKKSCYEVDANGETT